MSDPDNANAALKRKLDEVANLCALAGAVIGSPVPVYPVPHATLHNIPAVNMVYATLPDD